MTVRVDVAEFAFDNAEEWSSSPIIPLGLQHAFHTLGFFNVLLLSCLVYNWNSCKDG